MISFGFNPHQSVPPGIFNLLVIMEICSESVIGRLVSAVKGHARNREEG